MKELRAAAILQPELGKRHVGIGLIHACDNAYHVTVDKAGNVGGEDAKRLVCAYHKPYHVCLIGIEGECCAEGIDLGVLAGGVDDGIGIVDVLRLTIMELFALECLHQRGLAGRDASHQDQLFHRQVRVTSHTENFSTFLK